jgi:2'-5' RNA ligase
MNENEKYLLIAKPTQEVSNLIYVIQCLSTQKAEFSLPPHITIFPPFINRLKTENELKAILRDAYSKQDFRSSVNFDGVNCFEDGNIVFLKPDFASQTYLRQLHFNFINNLNDKIISESIFLGKDFNPHITLNTTSPNQLIEIVKSNVRRVPVHINFDINQLYLYKKTQGENGWDQKAIIFLR